jgi:hypothetical protein
MSPDIRKHRGAHPADAELFAADRLPALRRATAELSWLLSHGYRIKSALKLVGDRHDLRERQRQAVARAACSDQSLAARRVSRLAEAEVAGQELVVDGFNLIITAEAALSGGVLIGCRDGCVRDLSGVHGSYRAVEETTRAILAAGETLATLRPVSVLWLLDSPISNSGRLAARLREAAEANNWPWSVAVVFNPDREMADSSRIAVTSDSNILDGARRWLNLNPLLIARHVAQPWLVNLSNP